jgi:rhodanese-related sulfurtransferase
MRAVLLCTALAFGLTACAPQRDKEENGTSGFPGYELAMARDAAPTAQEPPLPSIGLVSAEDLAALVAAGKVRLIDVRSPEEFATGHLEGAINIPAEAPDPKTGQPMSVFDPTKVPSTAGIETILYCRSGRRSEIAAQQLAGHTGKVVRHLDGGIVAWQAAGLRVVNTN